MSAAKFIIIVMFVILFSACGNSFEQKAIEINDEQSIKDSIRLWMKDVNAYYFATLLPNGKMIVVTSGKDTAGNDVDGNTIFEGASISKTITAYTYWKLMNTSLLSGNIKVTLNRESCQINPLFLLQHRIKTERKDKSICVPGEFEYSEENYLMLQNIMENNSQSDLDELCKLNVFDPLKMNVSGLLWQQPYSYVNGFVENKKFHRYIYKYDEPFSNGSLYTCGNDMVRFANELTNGEFTKFVDDSLSAVKGFPNLY